MRSVKSSIWGSVVCLLCIITLPCFSQDLPHNTETPQYRAEQDTAFIAGSGIEISELSPFAVDKLTLLGKIWGFLKYHHPQVAAGNYNLDFELFRILPKVMRASNAEQRDQVLLDWIEALGNIDPCSECPTTFPGEHKITPDLSWIDTSGFSAKLAQSLHHVFNNRNQGENYYIRLQPNVLNPIFINEDAYEQFTYPDTGYRLLALYRYWNMIQYFFPYKHLIEEDWHEVLREFVPTFVQAEDDLAYRLACLALIGRIHDTHANIWDRDTTLQHWKGGLYAPFQVKFIEDKLVVTDYYKQELGERSKVKIGDVILQINDESVSDIIERLRPYFPASNEPTRLRNIARDILRSNHPTVRLLIDRDGKKQEVIIDRADPKDLNLRIDWSYRQPDTCFTRLPGNIGYINLGNIRPELLDTIFAQFADTRGLIIDIRNYPRKFVVFSLGKFLVAEPTEFVKFTYGDIHTPGLFHWTPPIKVGEEGFPVTYSKPVVILVNEISQSQAEYTTMAFQAAPQTTVIGSTTAGADGNVSYITLPGSVESMISGIGVYYPDGRETQRIGIVPDIVVQPTMAGIKAGRDELLERAVSFIQTKAKE